MSFENFKIEDARLTVLRFLVMEKHWSMNEFVLKTALEQMAHTLSRDQVRTQLAWLEEQGLVTIVEVSGWKVARLTSRGEEAANGTITVPGVKRPSPGDL